MANKLYAYKKVGWACQNALHQSLLGPTQVQNRAAGHSGLLLRQRAWGFKDEHAALRIQVPEHDDNDVA
jgi:hypothetical protein